MKCNKIVYIVVFLLIGTIFVSTVNANAIDKPKTTFNAEKWFKHKFNDYQELVYAYEKIKHIAFTIDLKSNSTEPSFELCMACMHFIDTWCDLFGHNPVSFISGLLILLILLYPICRIISIDDCIEKYYMFDLSEIFSSNEFKDLIHDYGIFAGLIIGLFIVICIMPILFISAPLLLRIESFNWAFWCIDYVICCYDDY